MVKKQSGKGLGRRIRRAARRVKKVANKASRAVHKASRNRFVKAARRAADYGIKFVPIAGNVYSLADLGVRGARAATRGKLGQFAAKEAAQGLFETVAPQAAAAVSAQKAKEGVARALIEGKGLKVRRRKQK